jgi:imidazolonepropionase-like amidohydrolase
VLAIRGAKVVTITKGTIDDGVVLVDGGKIAAVGYNLPVPESSEVVDAVGHWLVPGFIDCHCHVGIIPLGLDREYGDVNESTNAVTGDARAIDGVYFDDEGFRDAIAGGVTAMIIHPGSQNTIGGTSVAVKAAGDMQSRVLLNPAGMKAAWSTGAGGSPARDVPYVSTRMGAASLLRQYFTLTQEYMRRLEAGESPAEKNPARRETYAALAKVLTKEVPLRVHSMRPMDFYALCRLQDEFGIKFTIEHGDEAWVLAPELARRGVPVVFGPLMGDGYISVFPEARADSPRLLDEAGVLVSFQTDHPYISIGHLRHQATIAVKSGLAPERALRMLTINAATIMGMEHRLGSIEPGKDADFSLFSGDPLLVRSKTEAVFIDGVRVK